MRAARREQRGFTLLVVAILMVVLGLAGLGILQLIRLDLSITGQSRRSFEARDTAEGGVLEVLNDVSTPNLLTDLGSALGALSVAAAPPSASPFINASLGATYSVKINLLRVAPMSESSYAWTRAMVYELDGASSMHNGDAQVDVRAEVYKPVAFEPGTILPNKHFR